MKKLVIKYPLFVLLLPVFFVLHGFMENYDFVPIMDAVLLTGFYFLSSIAILLVSRLFFRDWLKAAFMTFTIMAFHFFFGTIQDALRSHFHGAWITKYAFLVPAFFSLLLLIAILLKKTKRPLQKLASYLNILFLLLIAIDIIFLAGKISRPKKDEAPVLASGFIDCPGCSKPDVYVIICDEYAGDTELKDIFQFDNTPFFKELAARGFHVIPKSRSNYNFTHYSIASTLNMDYLELQQKDNQPLLPYVYEKVKTNKLLHFLQYHQYKFYNHSLVDFEGDPAHTQETFLPVKTRLITSQTFVSRINREVRYHLVTWLKSKKEIRKNVYATKENNETLIPLTLKAASEKTPQPKFVLTHLMMPHYPYYYDRNGNEFPFEQLMEGNQHRQHNYIEYLQYSNKKILEITDHILANSATPPVIVLIGDHGFRHFDKPVDPKYFFFNLAAVHLPGSNYSAFTDSLTNVNLLRAVLNTTFGQKLPYLKDTTIIVVNP